MKMPRNRRGLAASQLVVMIIVIAGFMLIAAMLTGFLAKAEDSEAEVLCHNSIAMRAAMTFSQEGKYSDSEIKTFPVLCKTTDKDVEGDREEIMAEMSYRMARCFWMFGEGRYDNPLQPSRTDFLPSIMGRSDPEKTCFNCFTLLIDQDEIEGGPISQAELIEYMAKTNHPNIKDTTYLEYFDQEGMSTVVGVLTDIKPNHGYMISILPAITKEGEPNWLYRIAAGVAVTAGVVVVGACAVATVGACAAGAGALAAGVGAATAKGAAIVAISAKIAGADNNPGATPTVSYEELFKQRRFPSVYLSELSATKQLCNSGDIAGE